MLFIHTGWTSAKKQIPIAILIFLYQLMWGAFLYKIIQSAILPVLRRYPDPGPGQLSRLLFIMEGQLSLPGSHELRLYIGLLAGMVLIRIIMTPLIRSGIYHGLLEERDEDGAGWLFFEGIRKRWKPVTLFYLLELLLTFAPAYWIFPRLYAELSPLISGDRQALLHAFLLLAAWALWIFMMKKGLEYMLLGYLSGSGVFSSLLWCVQRFPSIVVIAVILGGASLLTCVLCTTGSWIWTGIAGLILHQIYPLFSSFLAIWQTASRYHLWKTIREK